MTIKLRPQHTAQNLTRCRFANDTLTK